MKKYDYAFWIGIGIWVVETICFGFNSSPASHAESFFDLVSATLIIYGTLGSFIGTVVQEYTKGIQLNLIVKKDDLES